METSKKSALTHDVIKKKFILNKKPVQQISYAKRREIHIPDSINQIRINIIPEIVGKRGLK